LNNIQYRTIHRFVKTNGCTTIYDEGVVEGRQESIEVAEEAVIDHGTQLIINTTKMKCSGQIKKSI